MQAMNEMDGEQGRLKHRQRRIKQRREFHRNQGIGLLLLAACALVYRLLHTPVGWIFPSGWWRFW